MEKSWKAIKNIINSDFDYGDSDKYIKTKIKIYGGSVNTNFQRRKMLKEKVTCKSLSIIMLDSFSKAKKKCYHQTLLKECKFELIKYSCSGRWAFKSHLQSNSYEDVPLLSLKYPNLSWTKCFGTNHYYYFHLLPLFIR